MTAVAVFSFIMSYILLHQEIDGPNIVLNLKVYWSNNFVA